MIKNRAVLRIAILCVAGGWWPGAAAQAQSDFAGTWDVTPEEAAVDSITFCVVGSDVVVDGTGELSPSGTIAYASGSVDANGVLALTVRASNSQTSLSTTQVFTGNLSLSGTGSGTVNLTNSSGTNLWSDWEATRNLIANPCTGAGAVPLSLAISSLPRSIIGSAYTATLTAKGGIPPYTYAVAGLPGGLSFNAATATISGTSPSGTAGSYPLQITLTDDIGRSTQGQLVLVVGVSETGSEGTVTTFPCGATTALTLSATGLILGLMRFSRRRLRRG